MDTNYNLIGVALAPGTQRIELEFADPGYARGRVITLVSVGLAVLVLMLGVVMDRRRVTAQVATVN